MKVDLKGIQNLPFFKDSYIFNGYPFEDTNIASVSFYSDLRYCDDISGGGTSTYVNVAIKKAIYESIERYSSYHIRNNKIIQKSIAELTKTQSEFLHPDIFATYADNQKNRKDYPYKKINDSTILNWVEGKSLNRNENVWIPDDFAFITDKPIEERIWEPISTGIAIHQTYDNALASGLFEVIERDSFIFTWKKKIEMDLIDINSLKKASLVWKTLIEKYESSDHKLYIMDITMEHGIPCFLGVCVNKNEGPSIVVEASSNSNFNIALDKIIQSLPQLYLFSSKFSDKKNIKANDIHNLDQRAEYYYSSDKINECSFLWKGKTISMDEIRDRHKLKQKYCLKDVINSLYKGGIDLYVCNLTYPGLEKYGYVLNVIAPNALNLDISHKWQYNGGKRLSNLRPILKEYKFEKGTNESPHPFV